MSRRTQFAWRVFFFLMFLLVNARVARAWVVVRPYTWDSFAVGAHYTFEAWGEGAQVTWFCNGKGYFGPDSAPTQVWEGEGTVRYTATLPGLQNLNTRFVQGTQEVIVWTPINWPFAGFGVAQVAG